MAVYAEDFFTGIFAAFAARGITSLKLDDRFHRAMEVAFECLFAKTNELDVRFRIRVHPIHGDSEVVHDGLRRGASSGMLSYIGPSYREARITVEEGLAEALLAALPGGRVLYEELAEAFLAARSLH
jgi:hypothetical protein